MCDTRGGGQPAQVASSCLVCQPTWLLSAHLDGLFGSCFTAQIRRFLSLRQTSENQMFAETESASESFTKVSSSQTEGNHLLSIQEQKKMLNMTSADRKPSWMRENSQNNLFSDQVSSSKGRNSSFSQNFKVFEFFSQFTQSGSSKDNILTQRWIFAFIVGWTTAVGCKQTQVGGVTLLHRHPDICGYSFTWSQGRCQGFWAPWEIWHWGPSPKTTRTLYNCCHHMSRI